MQLLYFSLEIPEGLGHQISTPCGGGYGSFLETHILNIELKIHFGIAQ